MSHHVKPPYRKGPSDRDHPEFLSRHVSLLCIALTSIKFLDYVLCIRIYCEPGEAMSKGFSYKRTRAGMVSAISRVYSLRMALPSSGETHLWKISAALRR